LFMVKIPLSRPIISDEMKNAAVLALENEKLVMGESVFKFEEEFARYIGTKYAVSVNSGTFALTSSLIARGVKKNEPILTTPMSFIATANSIIQAGGRPVFSDVEGNTGNIDPTLFGPKIRDVKGIVPVHLYGNPCNLEQIYHQLKENDIFVIEDACQAHGAEYGGKKVGSIGDAGCFSFYSIKNMTVGGDGGMVTTNDEDLAEKVRILRDCGRIDKYKHSVVGYTARLNTINAAIGLIQLRYLDDWNEKRKNTVSLYRSLIPKEHLLDESVGSVHHIFAIKLKNRDKVSEHLNKCGIETGVHYPIPIHLQPIYRDLYGYKEGDYPISEAFSKEVLSLPLYPGIPDDDVEYVCECIAEMID
ncbi:DegT/DnrJ/EryC1/StrS family aminotransferase, partial [Methanoculleus sp. UBA331]|uniref:DegT/DnrJ/EryC1/StrS family aminotransferase n=2 Tax=Methanoculleus TaxID=45989 RepID=UPI00319E5580